MAGRNPEEIISKWQKDHAVGSKPAESANAPLAVHDQISSETTINHSKVQEDPVDNEQAIRSLAFYIAYMRQNLDCKRQDLEAHCSDIGDFVSTVLEEEPPSDRIIQRRWHEAYDLLPIEQIDVERYFDQALARVFGGGAESETPSQGQSNVTVTVGTNYFARYVEAECKTEEERNALTMDVNSFWDRLEEYQTEENGHRAYGLAVGRVQSGKTRNYIGLMFKAIDEGYNTIIILTSKSKRLAVQTHKRVTKWFGEEKFRVPNFIPLTQLHKDVERREDGVEWRGADFASNRVHVGVVIKNEKGHLERIREWIGNLNPNAVAEMKLLFIDDESDNATPNTNNVGEPSISNESDVEQLVQTIKAVMAYGPSGDGDHIAEWVKEICAADFSQDTLDGVVDILKRAVTKKRMMDAVLENQTLISGAHLDEEVESNGQRVRLNRLVYDVFNKRATKRQLLNWVVLRDLLNYAFGVRQERSRINRSICELVGHSEQEPGRFAYGKMVYAGYTATPFANLLNENPVADPLCPDCVKPLSTSSKYFGLQRIFGSEGAGCNMDIVRSIDSDEDAGWVEALQNGEVKLDDVDTTALTRNHNFADDDQSQDVRCVEWKSLKRAVIWAFCTAAARRAYRLGGPNNGDYVDVKYRWTTMLFNLSHLSNQENGVHSVQQSILEQYLERQLNQENRESFIDACRQVWEDEIAKFSAQDFERASSGYGTPKGYPPWAQVEKNIREWFAGRRGKYQVIQMNSNSEGLDQLDYNDKMCQDGDVLWFVCGGNAISRGLTLEGLTVSYYDRIKRSSAVDSITQMGRWFGYRPGYELLPRIWMTDDTIGEMKNICRIEEQLHNELQDLFAEEDHTSIRVGRNVADIRYFGRRLSGRDANGMEIGALAAEGVFEIVDRDPLPAFERTQRFIGGELTATGIWQKPPVGYEHPLHGRHRFFWKDVSSNKVVAYLDDMEQICFRGASKALAQGIIREMRNSLVTWNVVIGNPNTNPERTIVEGVTTHLRGNRIERESSVDGAMRIGKKQLTMNALYTALPSAVIGQAEDEVRGRYAGDLTEKFETLDIANRIMRERGEDASLTNPTLLIDFINNGDGTPYVQVSFYWYGHDTGSFFRAIINPSAPTLLPSAIEIVRGQDYISFNALKRILGTRFQNLNDGDFSALWDDLRRESQSKTGMVGIVMDEESQGNGLFPGVVYSKEWYNHKCGELGFNPLPGHIIGPDLYRRIHSNGWGNGNEIELSALLTTNNYDFIVNFAMRRRHDGDGIQEYKDGIRQLKDVERVRESGEGLRVAIINAVSLFQLSAIKGCPFAKYKLGEMCEKKNPERASKFFKAARESLERLAKEGNNSARQCLDHIDNFIQSRENPAQTVREADVMNDSLLSDIDWLWIDKLTPTVKEILAQERIQTVGEFVRFVENGGLKDRRGIGKSKMDKYKSLCLGLKESFESGNL